MTVLFKVPHAQIFLRLLSPILPAAREATILSAMPATNEINDTAPVNRLARAQQAYREHYGYGYWSTHPVMEITEKDIPFVIDGLRRNGGHKEWREAQALVARR